jgi:hypothetical protein
MVDIKQMVNFDYSYQNLLDTSMEERFSMIFRPVERPLLLWRDEILATACKIKELAGDRPLILSLSGGLDGEIAAYAFIECGIDFSVLTCKHLPGTNQHDISNAINFCNKNNIKQTIFDINPYEFFTSGIEKYINRGYRSTKMFRYFQLLLIDTIESMGGCAVLGGGDQMYYNMDNTVSLSYAPDFNLVLEHIENIGNIHFPYFYMQNSCIFAAYMKEELINFVLSNPKYFRNTWAVSLEKELVYNKDWPNLPKRIKHTGFEYMHYFKLAIEKELYNKFNDINEMYIPISTVKQQLGI